MEIKSHSKSFKLKKQIAVPKEDWVVHKDKHPAIIERSMWEIVQKTFGGTKLRKPKNVVKSIFAGFLKCPDCGANLNHKTCWGYSGQENHFFHCKNYSHKNGLCAKSHHIRVDVISRLVRNDILNIVQFANLFEDEFVKIVVDEHYKRIQSTQKQNQDKLAILLNREKEIDVLIEKLFEEKVLGNLTEERFLKLSYKYEDEQMVLKQQIKQLKKIVLEKKAHEMNADGFLQIVRKYENFEELSLEILQEFIDKIVVHHRENIHGEMVQNVEIHYKMIGHVKLPFISKKESESLQKSFGRKQKREVA